jgi:hypothetical protein
MKWKMDFTVKQIVIFSVIYAVTSNALKITYRAGREYNNIYYRISFLLCLFKPLQRYSARAFNGTYEVALLAFLKNGGQKAWDSLRQGLWLFSSAL